MMYCDVFLIQQQPPGLPEISGEFCFSPAKQHTQRAGPSVIWSTTDLRAFHHVPFTQQTTFKVR